MVITAPNGHRIDYDELPDSLLQQLKDFGKRTDTGGFKTLFAKLELNAEGKIFSSKQRAAQMDIPRQIADDFYQNSFST